MSGFLRFGPLFLGTCLLVSASLGCSFWFFYSFLDGNSSSQIIFLLFGADLSLLPMVAGFVGCGAQLFVYSFAANLSHIKDALFKGILIVISTLTISLSMFSTYSTLISFLEEKSKAIASAEFIAEQRQKIIESRNVDIATNSTSAEQAVSDKYRTQSKGLTANNEALRQQQLRELGQMNNAHGNASPLDGLVRVVGNDSVVSALFCAWLAITFDLLPILGISLLGRLPKERLQVGGAAESLSDRQTGKSEESPVPYTLANVDKQSIANAATVADGEKTYSLSNGKTNKAMQVEQVPIGTPSPKKLQKEKITLEATESRAGRRQTAEEGADPASMGKNTLEKEEPPNHFIQDIMGKKPIYSELPEEYQNTEIGDVPTGYVYPILTRFLSNELIPLSYAGVTQFSGLSKWKVQQYFTKAVEEGFLVNKTPENIEAGYVFTKTVRYHIKREIDIEAVINECTEW